jgi:hypothetical protein
MERTEASRESSRDCSRDRLNPVRVNNILLSHPYDDCDDHDYDYDYVYV